MIGIDEACFEELFKLRLCMLLLRGAALHTVCQRCGTCKGKFIPDRCVVRLGLAPPVATTYSVVAFEQVVEDLVGSVKILLVPKDIVGLTTSQRPPALVVSKIVEPGVGMERI